MTTRFKSESTTDANYKNAKLLIIEDNPDQGVIVTSAVQQCMPGVKPVLASSEAEALAYLDQCRLEEWEFPKLILLDLYLPERENGWRLLDRLKSMPAALSKIPVVLFSNSAAPSDIAEAYERGCSSYLVKPGQFADWVTYFSALRTYWWETVTLPKVGISLF